MNFNNFQKGYIYFIYALFGVASLYVGYLAIHMWYVGVGLFVFAIVMLFGKIICDAVEGEEIGQGE